MANKKDITAQDVVDDVVKTEKYNKDVGDLTNAIINIDNRLKNIEEKFQDNDKITATLAKVQEYSKQFDNIIGKTFVDLLERDEVVRTKVADFIQKVDRNQFKRFIMQIGFIGWSIAIIVITAIITAFASKLIH